MKRLFEGVIVILSFVFLLRPSESRGDWTPEFLSQTRRKKCILGNIRRDVTFLHGTDSGNFQKLGKVADIDVCVLLCCEMKNCEAAFMADRNCYAVKCHSEEHCVTAPARKNKWHPLVVFVKKISQPNDDKVHQTAHAQDKQNEISREHAQKEKSAVREDVKNSQISEDNGKLRSPIMDTLTIAVKSKSPVIRLDEEVTKRKTIPLDKRKIAMREAMFKKSKYSLVSAAVLTCSMAVVLSGVAVIAAKIRKKREARQEPEYSAVPTTEE